MDLFLDFLYASYFLIFTQPETTHLTTFLSKEKSLDLKTLPE